MFSKGSTSLIGKIPFELLEENQIVVIVKNIQQTRNYLVDKSSSLLDLLKILINEDQSYSESSFIISNIKIPIVIQNATNKIEEYLESEKKNLTLFESGCLNPKNDLLKAINIIKIHKYNLQETTNLHDVDCINLAKIGEWNGFGRGPISVPREEDNHLRNIIFIKKGHIIRAYNVYSLLKILDENTMKLKIPIFEHELNEVDVRRLYQTFLSQSMIFNNFSNENFQMMEL